MGAASSAAETGTKRLATNQLAFSRASRARGPPLLARLATKPKLPIFDARPSPVLEPQIALGVQIETPSSPFYHVTNTLVPKVTFLAKSLDTEREVATFEVPDLTAHSCFTALAAGTRVTCFDSGITPLDGGAELALTRALRSLVTFGEDFAPPLLVRETLGYSSDAALLPAGFFRLTLEPKLAVRAPGRDGLSHGPVRRSRRRRDLGALHGARGSWRRRARHGGSERPRHAHAGRVPHSATALELGPGRG